MDLQNIGQRIKQFREAKKWRQEDLAKESGVPTTTTSKIEGGFIKNPSIEKIAKIAEALEVSVDSLLNKQDEANNRR